MIFGPLTVYIFMFNSSTTEDVLFGDMMNYWLRVIPSYNVSKTLLFCGTRLILERRMNDPELNYPQEINLDRWSYENQLGDLYVLIGHAALGIVLIIFFEAAIYRNCWARCFYCMFQCCFRATNRQIEDAYGDMPLDNPDIEVKDSDVFEEEKRVAKTRPNDLPVRVASLKKVFRTGICKNLTAVNNVSFGLDQGECFALLGVNGAGKTTVFKSLTNDTVPTGGRVSIGGWDVQRWFGFARKRIGYCPQHNTLFE
jgi:ABC-type multidrug transport system fused ATPase/permease subunit